MATLHIDQTAIQVASLSIEDTDETHVETEGFVIPVVIPLDQVGDYLALYDPASGTSPTAAESRKIARAVLDALIKAAEE